jgi:glycosyltransferase involved in cell wall biosynthesis
MKFILKEFQPDVIMSWQLRASRFMPAYNKARRISRLGDYPEHLGYYTNSQTLVCITPDIANKVRELGWTRGVEVIPNFTRVVPSVAISRSELQTPEQAFVVLGMGRFVKRKGFDMLLRAVARIDGAYLWLLGNGPEEENLKQLARELHIEERVRFPGWRSDAHSYLAAANAFTVTSLHEPLGNVCFEGWGAGKPTVSSRAEGPSWVMTDGKDALMVECGDADGLAAALCRIRDEPGLAERLIEGGRKTLAERFSEEAIVQSYLRLFSTGSSAA